MSSYVIVKVKGKKTLDTNIENQRTYTRSLVLRKEYKNRGQIQKIGRSDY